MSNKNHFVLFIYILFACVIGMNIVAMVSFISTGLFLLVFHNVPFALPLDDIVKYSKAASFAGVIIAIGCWYMYYRHYKRYR